MIFAIVLIVLGLLAVPSLVLKKKPNAKELFDKVAPYQGWFGVICALWGVWGIISLVLNLGMLGYAPLTWVLWLAVDLVLAGLGFILGYGLIQKYALSKNEKAAAKGGEVLAKLLPLQGRLGIAAIILGLIDLVYIIIL